MQDFQGQDGQTFTGADQLMKYIAFGIDLGSRREEVQSSSALHNSCTVIWPDGARFSGVTPLYWACAINQTETALLLIKAGADVNALVTTNEGEQISPLNRATKLANEVLTRALLDNGATTMKVDSDGYVFSIDIIDVFN